MSSHNSGADQSNCSIQASANFDTEGKIPGIFGCAIHTRKGMIQIPDCHHRRTFFIDVGKKIKMKSLKMVSMLDVSSCTRIVYLH